MENGESGESPFRSVQWETGKEQRATLIRFKCRPKRMDRFWRPASIGLRPKKSIGHSAQNESSDEERCIKAETPHTNKWLGKQNKEKLEEESARTVQWGIKNRWHGRTRARTHTYGKIKSDTQERTTCIHMCGDGILGALEPERW